MTKPTSTSPSPSPRMRTAIASHRRGTSGWVYKSYEAMENMQQYQEFHYFNLRRDADKFTLTLVNRKDLVSYDVFSTGPQTCVTIIFNKLK